MLDRGCARRLGASGRDEETAPVSRTKKRYQSRQRKIDKQGKDSEEANFAGRFDVVNASWLYDTARDEEEALRMARNIHRCLKNGGRHQGLEINFGIHASHPSELELFGISLMPDRPAGTRPTNGGRIRGDIAMDTTEVMTIHVTYFDKATFTSLLRDAGFKNIRFYPPDTWDLGTNWAASPQGKKFKRYVTTNLDFSNTSGLGRQTRPLSGTLAV